MATHQERIQEIAASLAHAHQAQELVSIQKDSVSHTVPKNYDHAVKGKVNLKGLNRILEIKPHEKICVAESGVTFEELARETLKLGLLPYTVPELKTITVGGAISGCSVESMSYKYGGFWDSCLEIEAITATGEILTCSPTQNQDVFEMVHGSYGTVAIITKVTFKLLDAKPYVRLDFHRYPNAKLYEQAIMAHYEAKDVDFMDGIIHGPDEYDLCIGTFVDDVPHTSDYSWTGIYHKSAREKKVDYLKTYDYLFRYDADCHWIARNFGLENPVLRTLLGPFFLSSSKLLNIANNMPFKSVLMGKPDVVVDVFIPIQHFEAFYREMEEKFGYYPIWIVPYKLVDGPYKWMNPNFTGEIQHPLVIDIAIYGLQQSGQENYYEWIEEKVYEYGGFKTLISYNYYSKERFWEIFDEEAYLKVKAKTDPNNIFRNVYEKMKSN